MTLRDSKRINSFAATTEIALAVAVYLIRAGRPRFVIVRVTKMARTYGAYGHRRGREAGGAEERRAAASCACLLVPDTPNGLYCGHCHALLFPGATPTRAPLRVLLLRSPMVLRASLARSTTLPGLQQGFCTALAFAGLLLPEMTWGRRRQASEAYVQPG